MKTLILILILLMAGCKPDNVTVEITYMDNTKETLNTQIYTGCHNAERLKAGCTDCLMNSRCNVKSVKTIK